MDTGGDTELEKNRNEVLRRIAFMARSTACNDAFTRAGLKTPFDFVQDGLTVVSRRALTDSSYNSTLGITESVRKTANDSYAPLQTIRPQFTSSRRPVLVVAGDAFSDNFLEEGIPHEFIHAAGFNKQYGWTKPLTLGAFGHDLDAYPHYSDIIKNCKL